MTIYFGSYWTDSRVEVEEARLRLADAETRKRAQTALLAAGVAAIDFRMEWYNDEDSVVDYRALDAQGKEMRLPDASVYSFLDAYAWSFHREYGTGTFHVEVASNTIRSTSSSWSSWTYPEYGYDDEGYSDGEYDDES